MVVCPFCGRSHDIDAQNIPTQVVNDFFEIFDESFHIRITAGAESTSISGSSMGTQQAPKDNQNKKNNENQSSSTGSKNTSNNSSAKDGNTSGSSSGDGQPPRNNRNNRKNNGQRSATPSDSHMVIFLRIFNAESIDDIGMGRPAINIFYGLADGQIKTLKKCIKKLWLEGYLEVVIEIILCIFNELYTDDITFQNFLGLVNFVDTYIGEYIAERVASNRNGLLPDRRQEQIDIIRRSIYDFARNILKLFNELRDEVNAENNQLSPSFRNIFSAIYHWYKHRLTPNGKILSIKEYFEWIKKQLKKLKELRVYSDLIDGNHPKQVVVYETFYVIFDRRLKIVLKIQDGSLELSSCYVVDAPHKGDEEGDEFIDGVYVTVRKFMLPQNKRFP